MADKLKLDLGKKAEKGKTGRPKKESVERSGESPDDMVIATVRMKRSDRRVLSVYAFSNNTTAQDLLIESLRLIASERDIPFSDELIKGVNP